MVNKIQPSFAAGELAPSLHARVDLAKYNIGLKRARNIMIHAHGGASNRPGLEFIGEVKDHSKRVRLLPFQFNTEQTYIIEAGDQYMRFWMDGGQILDGDGTPYEIVTPYIEADLRRIKFVQSADVMTLTHPSYETRDLSRTGHANWSLDVVTFAPKIGTPTNLTVTQGGSPGTTTYEYAVTAYDDETGEESLAATVTTNTGNGNLSSTNYNSIDWDAVSGASRYYIYKKKNGVFGWIGQSETAGPFKDDGIEPDISDVAPPTTARNPFASAGQYPGAVTYHEQRRAFGGSYSRPQTVWLTQAGRINNMNVSQPTQDDDAITVTIASREVNEIRHLVSLGGALLLMTSGAEWSLDPGTQSDALTPAGGTRLKPQSYFGSSHVPPIIIGNRIIFVQEKGAIVRDLGYSFESDSFIGIDLSILANHLFAGHEIVEWAYAKAPHSIIYAIRDDGICLAFTYLREHEVWAWSWFQTDGKFESVAVISEGQEDVPYFVVRRVIGGQVKRYIERLHTRYFEDVRKCFFVDSGLTYDDPKPITGVTATNPVVVTCTGHGFTDGDEVYISDIEWTEKEPGVQPDQLNGKRYIVANADTDTFELTDEDGNPIDGTDFLPYVSGGYARKSVNTISGLDHLEGKEVAILADGNVMAQQVVTNGTITLERAAAIVHVGLPYKADLITLPLELQPTVQGKRKKVSKITLRVEKSRGLWGGPGSGTENDLVELKQRELEAWGEPIEPKTGDVELTINSLWDNEGSIWIQQRDPLPLTVLAIIPEVEIGD